MRRHEAQTAAPGAWRGDVLLEVCRIIAAFMLLPALAIFASRVREGLVLDAAIGLLLYGVLAMAAVSRRVPPEYRAVVMLVIVTRIAFNIVSSRGLGLNVSVLAGTAALLALLAWGGTAAAVTIGVGTAALVAAAVGTAAGWIATTPEENARQAMITIGLFMAMTGIGIAMLSSVVTRLEAGVRSADALAGRLRTEARERMARMERVVSEEETLRGSLAHELHDDIGQRLTAVKITLDMARVRRPGNLAAACRESVRLLDDLANDVSLSANLRPALIDEAGLCAAIQTLVDEETRRAGITAHLDLPEGLQLPDDLQTACYRIVQEALTNTLRHARARSFTVRGRRVAGGVAFIVRDDGGGFDADAALGLAAAGERLGLLGMRERAQAVGADLEIVSSPGAGTEIRLLVPVEEGA